MLNNRMRHMPRGFTLIELIVIILIIAIAAGLILPILARSRGTSRRPRCASNLNQIAKAMFMYSDVPANGTFPCASSDPDTADPLLSLGLLYNKYVADPKVFSCPSKPVPPAALAAMVPGGPVATSYGYDPHHGPDDAIAAIASDWKGAGQNSDNHGPNVGQNVMIGAGTIEYMESPARRFAQPNGTEWFESSIFARDPALPRNEDGVIRKK